MTIVGNALLAQTASRPTSTPAGRATRGMWAATAAGLRSSPAMGDGPTRR